MYAPFAVTDNLRYQAAELVRSGEITAAVQLYQEALKLDPSLDIDPQQEVDRIYIDNLRYLPNFTSIPLSLCGHPWWLALVTKAQMNARMCAP